MIRRPFEDGDDKGIEQKRCVLIDSRAMAAGLCESAIVLGELTSCHSRASGGSVNSESLRSTGFSNALQGSVYDLE